MKTSAPQQGFTLLEVLVASVIFISVAAVVTIGYRGALLSSQRANANVVISGVVPSLVEQIQREIRSFESPSQTLSGDGDSWGVTYEWQARQLSRHAAQPTLDIEIRQVIVPEPRFIVWEVSLNVVHDGTERIYNYEELSWTNEF